MFIMMLVHIFFFLGGTMSCLYCSWVALLRTLSFFFLWGIFFENHGLGLGPVLFRLGLEIHPNSQGKIGI
jgi:hypothetical protein